MGLAINREQRISTSGRRQSTGDDLVSARVFTDEAALIMDDLMSEKRLETDFAQMQVQKLRDEAATLSARAVHIAAAQALDLMDVKAPQARIDGQLVCLFNLIQQYQKGLDEITAPADTHITAKSCASDQQAFDTAKTVLEPLLGLTQTRRQYDALSFLAGLTPHFSAAREISSEAHQPVEMAIPAFTQAVLSSAHHLGRTVSVSYDIHGCGLISSRIESLKTILKTLGQTLVQHVIQKRRMNPDIAGHGHISLYAQAVGSEAVSFTLICQGQALPAPVLSALRQDMGRYGASDVDMSCDGMDREVQIRFTLKNQSDYGQTSQIGSATVDVWSGELAL